MYVGRIVAIGRSLGKANAVMYRVSSRSFPNRQAVLFERSAAIVPKPGFEGDIMKNPYIAYNCLRLAEDVAIAGNGSHTDPITEKIMAGLPIRDAMTSVLLAMDYERDDYNTPRIVAAAKVDAPTAYLGIIRDDAVLVREFKLEPGQVLYLCTYEHNQPNEQYCDREFNLDEPGQACRYILGQGVFANLERPVSAACAVAGQGGRFRLAVEAAGN